MLASAGATKSICPFRVERIVERPCILHRLIVFVGGALVTVSVIFLPVSRPLCQTLSAISRHLRYSSVLRVGMSANATTASPPFAVPEGFSVHSENSAHILLPNDNGAFLNPVQEFNRDLSVACIRTWGDQMNETRKKKWEIAQEKKAKRDEHGGKTKKPRSPYRAFLLSV